MTLSDAILAGSRLRPQCFGTLFRDLGSDALGAAAEASGCRLDDDEATWLDLYSKFPVIQTAAQCPLCKDTGPLGKVVCHLADQHRWTREEIATWVAKQEQEVSAE